LSRRKSTSLTASLEFERVYREGSVCRGKLFSIHALPNSVSRPRLGLSVSKKVGVAVKRNAVRRRLREIFRSAASDLPRGVDVVVSARAAAADAGFEELKQEFLAAMRKLNAQHAVGESFGGDV
jgi:ribonuclease P protein component